VLIGRPESRENVAPDSPTQLRRCSIKLRMRRLAEEQRATFAKQRSRATTGRAHQSESEAERQTELTQSAIAIEIARTAVRLRFAEAEQLARSR